MIRPAYLASDAIHAPAGVQYAMRRLLLALLCLLAPTLLHAQVKGETGGVYIADDAISFEQAAAEALRDRASSPPGPLAVLVSGSQLRRVTLTAASAESRGLADKLQAAGATVYVCERDVRAARLSPSDLLHGVRMERGWTKAEAQADVGPRMADDRSTPEATLRRIRRICAEP
jgi:intracellular sulfur oxidation DsrE/DsrF family protein